MAERDPAACNIGVQSPSSRMAEVISLGEPSILGRLEPDLPEIGARAAAAVLAEAPLQRAHAYPGRGRDVGDSDRVVHVGLHEVDRPPHLLRHRALDDFLPLCVEKKIGIMLGGPYNSGILATGAVPGAKYNYVDAPPEILARVAQIQAVCQRHGVPIAAAAIQFPLAHPAMSALIPGAVTPYEVSRNVRLLQTPIPADLWAELKHEGLLREDAPVPQ